MNTQDQVAIEELFQRLQQAEAQGGPRDADAQRLITDLLARQPAAPYLMAQAVLVQEQALRNLQGRVEGLEKELASRPQGGGGFLGGLFGAGAAQPGPAAQPAQPAQPVARSGGWGSGRPAPPGGSFQPGQGGAGRFLGGAMQTAMGVAGGVLLGNAIAGLFSGPAEAAPAAAEPAPHDDIEAAPEDEDGGFFDDFGSDEF